MDWSQHESDHDKALLLGHHTTGLLAESEDDFAALSDPNRRRPGGLRCEFHEGRLG